MRLPLVLAVVGLVVGTGGAGAEPLDAVVCDGAKREQSALDDVPAILERGPEWAKTHIDAGVLKRVQRWIELQEMLSFRCGRGPVTPEAQRAAAAAELIENPPPPPPAPAAAPGLAESPGAAGGASVTAPAAAAPVAEAVAKPRPKPKAKSKLKTDATAEGNTEAPALAREAPLPPKKKRPPKADAFVPPPASSESP